MLIFHVKKSDLKDMFLVVTWTKMRFFCRFETPSEIPANYLAGNFSELYAPVLQRETTHENSTFELASPSVRLTDCLQFPL
jgi:hypothetical protein